MCLFSETRIYAILNVLLRISTDNAEPRLGSQYFLTSTLETKRIYITHSKVKVLNFLPGFPDSDWPTNVLNKQYFQGREKFAITRIFSR